MRTHQRWKESINENMYFMNAQPAELGENIHAACLAVKPVNFYCSAHGAKTVQLSGAFNHWHPILMEQRDNGWWFIQLWLPHGHHQYRFLVDGKPTLDVRATGTGRNENNELVSLVAVN